MSGISLHKFRVPTSVTLLQVNNGRIWPKNGLKMAIVNLHQSATCGYSKLVPGDAWYHAKGIRANWSAILEKTFKMWPKIVKIGPFLTYFFLDNPPSLIFSPVVCYSIFGLFLYIKINFIHQNWAKPQYFPPKWPHMAQNGLKMAVVNLHHVSESLF